MSGLGSWTRDSANILGRVEPGRHGEPLPTSHGVLDLCLRDQMSRAGVLERSSGSVLTAGRRAQDYGQS
jgi:hypothetical protein